jgi:hypothetical protein
MRLKHWFVCRDNRLIYDDIKMYRANVYNMNGRRGYLVFYREEEDLPIDKENRAYYFKVLIGELSHHDDFYAMSPIQIHHHLMEFFNGEYIENNGEWEIWYPGMADMNVLQWRAYVEKVEYFVGEKLGDAVIKPLPTYKFR